MPSLGESLPPRPSVAPYLSQRLEQGSKPVELFRAGLMVSKCQILTVWRGGGGIPELRSELPDGSGHWWTSCTVFRNLGPALGEW